MANDWRKLSDTPRSEVLHKNDVTRQLRRFEMTQRELEELEDDEADERTLHLALNTKSVK